MLLSVTKDALTCLPNDLELQARVASLVSRLSDPRHAVTLTPGQFTAWATYTDGKLIGPDLRCTSDYIVILKVFYDRCTVTGKDAEMVSRYGFIPLSSIFVP